MRRAQRLNEILSALVADGNLDVRTLAERFGVSTATARRDLALLEEQRLLARTRGGATTHAAFHDLPVRYKAMQELPQKRRIAAAARQFLNGARVIGVTGGTTVTEFTRLLTDSDDGITVVTNALNIALDLVGNPRIRVLAAGGEARSSSYETVGASAESFLESCNLDVAFVGVDGVDAGAGCTNYDPGGARVNALMCRRARRRVVLADGKKIGRVALATVCDMNDVDVLVTDDTAAPDLVRQIEQRGTRVILA
ncbi:DeoR family transcriptional regulator [Actinopolymorpha pittospori]|uniref:DeoR family transcriptional regulator n=1 Tax=Actinopolymorpha pittospori TaxID=648752 RepID=UPI001789FACD